MRTMFQKLLGSAHAKNVSPRGRGRQARRKPPSRRLQLERLEDRLALSALTVTSGADSGPGSLRAEIAAANSGDTIDFAHSVHAITLTSGELSITKDLDIHGPGANKLTINGNHAGFSTASRVFDISGSVTVTIAGLTVANGEAAVTQPLGTDGGGGILNEPGATLYLNNLVLTNNTAVLSPATPRNGTTGDVCGGGLLNEGTAYLNGTTVTGNQALGGGSGTAIGGSTGGGIDNFEGTLFVTDSHVCNNQAISAACDNSLGYAFFALGGGIANYANNNGDGVSSTVTISNSSIANNEATGGAGVVINGGGIVNFNMGFNSATNLPVVIINGSTVSGNLAIGGDYGVGALGESAAIGGGIDSFGTLNVTNSTVADNQAIGGSHSTPVVGGVASPAAGAGQGGGIVNYEGVATISGSWVIGNRAIGGNTDSGPGSIADGGGIADWGAALPTGVPGTLSVTNSNIFYNVAIAGKGGPAASSPAVWGFAAGGGIDVAFSATAVVSNSALVGNQAVGGSGDTGGTGFGGGISLGFSTFFSVPGAAITDISSLTLTNSLLAGNVAQGGSGGAGTGGNGLGGGLAINPSTSATVTASAIDFNLALGGFGGTVGQGIGGGVYDDAGPGGFNKDLLTLLAFNLASSANNNFYISP